MYRLKYIINRIRPIQKYWTRSQLINISFREVVSTRVTKFVVFWWICFEATARLRNTYCRSPIVTSGAGFFWEGRPAVGQKQNKVKVCLLTDRLQFSVGRVGRSTEWVGRGLPDLSLKPPLVVVWRTGEDLQVRKFLKFINFLIWIRNSDSDRQQNLTDWSLVLPKPLQKMSPIAVHEQTHPKHTHTPTQKHSLILRLASAEVMTLAWICLIILVHCFRLQCGDKSRKRPEIIV